MSLPEVTPEPEKPAQPEDNFPSEEPILPVDFTPGGEPTQPSSARRRRRGRRYFVTPGDDERSTLLEKLARRAFPTFEFFLFALLCGAILGAGFILDSQALLLLGILLAPLMTPWVGLTLGTMTGGWRFFLQTLGALLTASLLVFLTGALAGLAGRIWMPLPLFQANMHSHLWWPNFVVLALGAVLLVFSFVRSEDKPILPSVMLSYELFLPLSAAGFGLGSGVPRIWPDGLLVFVIHLSLATLLGGIVLAVLRFKPARPFGYALTLIVGLASLAAVVVFTGLGSLILGFGGGLATLKPTPTSRTLSLPSVTAALRTPTPSAPTRTPTSLYQSTETPTPTPSVQPTPSYAVINSPSGGGALVRSEPGSNGAVVTSLLNGSLVEVLPEISTVASVAWVHVRAANGIEGWVLQAVLSAATPPPTPSVTATR